MDRRHFFSTLVAGMAGMVLDPERLLWVPGQRTYFFLSSPPREYLTIGMINREAWRALQNNLNFAASARVERLFDVDGELFGETVTLRVPQRYVVGGGRESGPPPERPVLTTLM